MRRIFSLYTWKMVSGTGGFSFFQSSTERRVPNGPGTKDRRVKRSNGNLSTLSSRLGKRGTEAVLQELFPPCSLHTSTSVQGSWIQILLVAQASGIPLHDDKLNLIVCRCSEAGCGLLERTLLQTRQKLVF